MKFAELFNNKKPFIGMIHTNSISGLDVLELAQKEIGLYLKYEVYPLIENYYGSTADCEQVLSWLHETHPTAIYGLNILGGRQKDEEAFRLAEKYGAKFVQIDSVCGHLKPFKDRKYGTWLNELRQTVDVVLLGGVRFKYQPVLSGRTMEQDLLLGMERCDAIVCTGEGTATPTPLCKLEMFKTVVKDFPVIVGAGVTIETVAETFQKADGAIVGSWIKKNHETRNVVDEELLKQMVQQSTE